MSSISPTILHASDIHFGAHLDDRVEAFVRLAHQLLPSLIVLTGDLTDGGRKAEYRLADAFLKRLPGPLFVVPGNHDAPIGDLIARFSVPYGRFRRLRGASLGIRLPAVSVASLQTAKAVQMRLDWSKGVVKPEMTHRALTNLPKGRERRWRIIAGHHPLIDPPNATVKGDVFGGQAAIEAAERHGVDLSLAGHTHESFIGRLRDDLGILLGVAPTLASPRLRGEGQGFHHYTLLEDGLDCDVWRWNDLGFALEKTVSVRRRAA
jgi:3',5'-cyclic AMP phosphodiesterase CpdA